MGEYLTDEIWVDILCCFDFDFGFRKGLAVLVMWFDHCNFDYLGNLIQSYRMAFLSFIVSFFSWINFYLAVFILYILEISYWSSSFSFSLSYFF